MDSEPPLICWEGRTAAGLRVPAELPALTIGSAIDRGWYLPAGHALMEPRPREYLPVYPMPPIGEGYW